jgi:hypothetical protein
MSTPGDRGRRLLVGQDLAGLIVAVDGGGPVTVLPGTHLAARGTTVFTSSNALAELSWLPLGIGILHDGRLQRS